MKQATFTRLFHAALFALCVFVAGCGGGGGGGGNQNNNTVFGILRDSAQSDIQVEGASVTIGGVTGVTKTVANATATDPVGSFRLTKVPVGSKTAIVAAQGTRPAQTLAFTPAIVNGNNPELALYVNIGQIRGRVLGTDGTPIADAFVVVNTELSSAFTRTAADGTFLLDAIPDGAAQLFANFGTASATRDITIGFGVFEAGDITLVNDPNPNPPGLPKTIVGKILARPTAGSGSTIPFAASGAQVALLRNGAQIALATTDSSGDYGFAVPAGPYAVRVLLTGYVTQESGVVTLADPNVPIRFDLTLEPN